MNILSRCAICGETFGEYEIPPEGVTVVAKDDGGICPECAGNLREIMTAHGYQFNLPTAE